MHFSSFRWLWIIVVMGINSDVCDDFLTAYPLSTFIPNVSGGVGIGGLILGLIYFLSASAAIFWIHQQRKNAMLGMSGAARHVILPFYIPLLYFSALSDIFVGLVIFFINTRFEENNTWTSSTVLSVAFAFQHLVIEGTAFILMQYGCGYQAVINTSTWGVIWAISTFFVYLLIYKDGNYTAYVVEACWNSVLIVFYGTLWLTPEKKLFRRSAVIFYSRFWALIRMGIMFSTTSVHFGSDYWVFTGDCFYDMFILPTFIILKPFVLYKALLIDSQWWQGVEAIGPPPSHPSSRQPSGGSGKARYYAAAGEASSNPLLRWVDGAVRYMRGYQPLPTQSGSEDVEQALQGTQVHHFEAIRGPLLGVEVGYNEAQGLAREVDVMQRGGTIKLLNFAYLKVDQRQKLGAGSFSTVYMGMYKNTPVAIKMLVTLDLNPDVIKRVNNEARILTSLCPHPNVVNIYGLAVLPPSVCIVLEVCEFGSLSDVLRGCNAAGHIRHPLKLTMADRMFLALGCAKGLQALHSFSPSLCHRDIKSFNFLIDSQLNAKIADLDLGDDILGPQAGGISAMLAHSSLSLSKDDAPLQKMANYTGTNMTWQAPEVLLGMGYSQRSDIYSLGLVLWEVIAAGKTTKKFATANGEVKALDTTYDSVPYSDCKNQAEVREKIVRGLRPSLQGFSGRSSNTSLPVSRSRGNLQDGVTLSMPNPHVTNSNVDDIYLDMLRHCWSADPNLRPRMSEVLLILEQCHANALHKYIVETRHIVNADIVNAEHIRLSYLTGHGHRGHHPGHTENPHLNHHFVNTLSAEFMTNLSILKGESKWSLLDNNMQMNYIILLAKSPNYIIYANKKFLQTTGFALYDLLAQEFDAVLDRKLLDVKDKVLEKLRAVQEFGCVEHMMLQAAESPDSYYESHVKEEVEGDVGMQLNALHEEESKLDESGGHSDAEQDEEHVSEHSNSTNYRNSHILSLSRPDQADVELEHERELGNSESDFLTDGDLVRLIAEGDQVPRRRVHSGAAAEGDSSGGHNIPSSSWTESLMNTLTNSYNKLPGLSSSLKENSQSIAQQASQSYSYSQSNLLSSSSNVSGKKKRKVIYIVVECNPIRL